MRSLMTTALLVGALAAVPLVGHAATSGTIQTKPAAKHAPAATHATRGVVKSVDGTTLVITRAGKKAGEMTFMLDQSTRREGTIAVGAPVSVRYREDGTTYMATAVTAHAAKPQAAHKAPSKG